MKTLVITGRLPGMNEYINADRANRYLGAKLKKTWQEKVYALALIQLKGYTATKPVKLHYTWFEPNKKRDLDNISAFGHKVIQDALVQAKVLENDGQEQIVGFSDTFCVDRHIPRIVVQIEEVNNDEN
jgi:Holliday junction resolvase RusA-like endonuclease